MKDADSDIVYFLLVYDLRRRQLVSQTQFADVDEAMTAYSDAESEHLGRGFEVVLVGSESIEAVMLTHGSYFDQHEVRNPRAGLSFSLS